MNAMAIRLPMSLGAAALLILCLSLTGCGGGDGGSANAGGGGGATYYSLGGTVSGLTAPVLMLANGGPTTSVASGATTFTFPTPVVSGATYTITIFGQPTGQTCSITNGSGTVASANVTNIGVTCITNTFAVGGTISALTAGGLVLANGTDTLSVAPC